MGEWYLSCQKLEREKPPHRGECLLLLTLLRTSWIAIAHNYLIPNAYNLTAEKVSASANLNISLTQPFVSSYRNTDIQVYSYTVIQVDSYAVNNYVLTSYALLWLGGLRAMADKYLIPNDIS